MYAEGEREACRGDGLLMIGNPMTTKSLRHNFLSFLQFLPEDQQNHGCGKFPPLSVLSLNCKKSLFNFLLEKRAFFKVVALDWLSSNAVHHSGGEYTIDVAAVYRYLC